MDGRLYQRNKAAFSNFSRVVWAGPLSSFNNFKSLINNSLSLTKGNLYLLDSSVVKITLETLLQLKVYLDQETILAHSVD